MPLSKNRNMSRPSRSILAQLFTALGKEYVVYIPTIKKRGAWDDLGPLVTLRNEIPRQANVVFDFSLCTRLPLTGIVFLGGLVTLIENSGGNVKVRVDTLKPKLRESLNANGFLLHMRAGYGLGATSEVPFEHHPVLDKSRVMRYLENKWLGGGAVRLSADLRAAIMGNAWEVYANAFEHADSPIGIMNCGSYDRPRRLLRLAVMDFGVGIPENVRRYRPGQTIDPRSAMKWAFSESTSTKAETVGYSRGLGLHTLKEFIKVNKGFMEVFSNDGYVRIAGDREIYRRRDFNLHGTLVQISLSADERFYCYDYEVPKF
jgi:hypothetical protein